MQPTLPIPRARPDDSSWVLTANASRCGIEADGFHCAAGWAGTLGVNWQRAKCLDEHGRALQQDVYGSPLTFSGGDSDTMALALLRAVYSCALLSI